MQFPIAFTKMSGTGNDFILVDNRRGAVPAERMKELAVAACRRGQSVGADGFILIRDDDRYDFAWDFFNSDGSKAEMCGNGARCAARFAFMEGICGPSMVFDTLAGPISGEVSGETVKVRLTPPTDLVEEMEIDLPDGGAVTVGSVNTGVPHVLVPVAPEELDRAPIVEMGRHIRYHSRFVPAGTNVNLVAPDGRGGLRIRTYERGVEGETLACGTGAVAAAVLAVVSKAVTPPVRVTTAGGDVLTIHLSGSDPMAGDIHLEGRAALVYRGQLTDETVSGG